MDCAARWPRLPAFPPPRGAIKQRPRKTIPYNIDEELLPGYATDVTWMANIATTDVTIIQYIIV